MSTRLHSRLRGYFTLLNFDHKYVFGNFLLSFCMILVVSAVMLFLFYLVLNLFGVNWSFGDTFLQMTNPQKSDDTSALEWMGIIATNLFGLFVLNGVVLTLLVNWVSNRKDRYNKGHARYKYIFQRPFAVIIGSHPMAASVARNLLSDEGTDFVIIQTQRDAEAVRGEIAAEINDGKIPHNVIIYSGSRTSWHELEELHLSQAKEIFILGEPGNIDGPGHDAVNIHTWQLITSHIREDKEEKTPCHIMVEHQSTFNVFQNADIPVDDSPAFRFMPFSIYQNRAQQVLLCPEVNGERHYLPLDGPDGLGYDSRQRVHLIVTGMSKTGIALAIEAAHTAHYPNFLNPDADKPRTLITMIDRNAKAEMMSLMATYRELFNLARWRFVTAPDGMTPHDSGSWDIYDTVGETSHRVNEQYPWHDPVADPESRSPYRGGYLGTDLIDIDFEFIEGDAALPSVQKYLADSCADETSKTTVAVCIPNAAASLSTALNMESSVYENAQQIWVLQPESGALADAIRSGQTGKESRKYSKLRAFGIAEKCDYIPRSKSLLPKLAAYAYDCINRHTSLEEEFNCCGDTDKLREAVERHWLGISQDGGKSAVAKRFSNIYCANSFASKIRSAGIGLSAGSIRDDAVVSILAKVEHNRWVIEQLLLGYRPVGAEYKDRLPVEDALERSELKRHGIHPDIISNDRLGRTQHYDKEIIKIMPLAIEISNKMTL